jgi:hypothetical protein
LAVRVGRFVVCRVIRCCEAVTPVGARMFSPDLRVCGAVRCLALIVGIRLVVC